MQRLVSAFVIARLVGLLQFSMAGLPASSLAPVNSVLSAAVRLVAGLGPRDHVTEHMKRLHWLPKQFRIKFKLCDLPGHSRLRSAAAKQYDVPFTRTQFGRRALSVAAPTE